MPRGPRNAPGGFVYHVINRGVGRQTLFHKDQDYAAFERVLAEACQHVPIRILAYCLMPNHRHSTNEPRTQGELEAIRRSVNRRSPLGSDEWRDQTVKTLGLEWSMRPRGRPRRSNEPLAVE
ncbi:MAG: transposase [Tepidisphaerales bacterium]